MYNDYTDHTVVAHTVVGKMRLQVRGLAISYAEAKKMKFANNSYQLTRSRDWSSASFPVDQQVVVTW